MPRQVNQNATQKTTFETAVESLLESAVNEISDAEYKEFVKSIKDSVNAILDLEINPTQREHIVLSYLANSFKVSKDLEDDAYSWWWPKSKSIKKLNTYIYTKFKSLESQRRNAHEICEAVHSAVSLGDQKSESYRQRVIALEADAKLKAANHGKALAQLKLDHKNELVEIQDQVDDLKKEKVKLEGGIKKANLDKRAELAEQSENHTKLISAKDLELQRLQGALDQSNIEKRADLAEQDSKHSHLIAELKLNLKEVQAKYDIQKQMNQGLNELTAQLHKQIEGLQQDKDRALRSEEKSSSRVESLEKQLELLRSGNSAPRDSAAFTSASPANGWVLPEYTGESAATAQTTCQN